MLKKKAHFNFLVVFVSLLLALTPFYGIAYILMILLGAKILKFSKIFSTFFSTCVLSFLLFTSAIMVAGLVVWPFRAPVYPVLCVSIFGLLLLALRPGRNSTTQRKAVDIGDIVSLALALIAPLIIASSFFLPKPSSAAIYQFVSNGWDNGSHINILQNDSKARGYIYEQSPDKHFINSKDRFGAYPQGWHLATSNFIDGFNSDLLNPKHPIKVLAVYTLIYFFWYATALYCFSRIAWELTKKAMGHASRLPISLTVFAIFSFIVQLVVFYGSLAHGFADYLGCVAYLLVLSSMIIEDSADRRRNYMIAIVAGGAATLSWLLPLPAIGLAIALGFLPKRLDIKSMRALLPSKATLPAYCITIVLIAAALAQAIIFRIYSHVKDGQINAGTLDGTFPVSPLLAVVAVGFGLLYWQRFKATNNRATALIAPFMALTFAIYIFQLFTAGATSYYFGKTLGLSLAIGGVFFVSASTASLQQLKDRYGFSSITAIILAATVVGLLVMGSSQDTLGLNNLFQRDSKVTYPTAQAITAYLNSTDPSRTKLVVMRHVIRAEDDNGYLYSLLPNINYTCANYVTGSPKLSIQLRNLSRCAHSLSNRSIGLVVITSEKTKQKVEALDLANVHIVNVP